MAMGDGNERCSDIRRESFSLTAYEETNRKKFSKAMPITSCVSKQLYNFVQFESLGLYVCYIQRAAGKHKEMAEEQHF